MLMKERCEYRDTTDGQCRRDAKRSYAIGHGSGVTYHVNCCTKHGNLMLGSQGDRALDRLLRGRDTRL